MLARLSLALVVLASAPAAAEGETSPLFGIGVLGARVPDHDAELAGAQAEVACWWGPFGLAAEGSTRWSIVEGGPRAMTLGGSARLLVARGMVPSLLERRDIEVGLELHAFAEETWWGPEDRAPGYGFGAVLRLRGTGDDDFSRLIAESRLFVRVSTNRDSSMAVARGGKLPMDDLSGPTVVIGIGAAFGTGDARYLDRFRLHPLDGF